MSQWLFTMSDILELISQSFYIKSFLYPFICSIFLTFSFLYTYGAIYNTCIIYIIWITWHFSFSVSKISKMFPSWNNRKPQIFVYGSWKLPAKLMVCSFLFPFAKEAFSGSPQFPSRPSMIRGMDRHTTRLGGYFSKSFGMMQSFTDVFKDWGIDAQQICIWCILCAYMYFSKFSQLDVPQHIHDTWAF